MRNFAIVADSEHLALIEQGVTTWNHWYKNNPKVVPDFSGANLSQLNLQGIDLRGANLTQVNFSNTDLSEANLTQANLNRASLLKANLSKANLSKANLDYVIFSQATINRQTLIDRKSLQIYKIVNNFPLDRNFSQCDLSNSNLFRVNFTGADLSNANLSNANLTNATLSEAYLTGADLSNANLTNANLTNTYLSHANLTKAYLGGALCCGTYFKDADLSFVDFKTTKFSEKTIIDLKWYSVWEIVNYGAVKKNLTRADLSNANLPGVNFKEANLTGAKLQNAILRGSNFTDTNLVDADLTGANICAANFTNANLKKAKLKSAIADRHTQLSALKNINNTNQQSSSVPFEELTTIQVAAPQADMLIPVAHSRSNKNILALLFVAIVAIFVVGAAIFIRNYRFSEPELEPWEQKVEQMVPAS